MTMEELHGHAVTLRSTKEERPHDEDGSYEIDQAELAQMSSFPGPSAAAEAPGKAVKVTVPSVRRALHVTDAELRYRIIRAEESLIELKSAMEDMHSQRDAWQAMAQAKLLPTNRATLSWWRWLRRTG